MVLKSAQGHAGFCPSTVTFSRPLCPEVAVGMLDVELQGCRPQGILGGKAQGLGLGLGILRSVSSHLGLGIRVMLLTLLSTVGTTKTPLE